MTDIRHVTRIETIERIVAPYTEGIDPELARGICAVFAGLVRPQFLRGMYEQWGLSGAEAGRAVEWAINALFSELHRKEGDWKTTKASPPDTQGAP
jgi:hypothetical protein